MVTTADILAHSLKELGIRYVFGVPSGNWVDYMAAIEPVDGLDFVLVSNEASGAFMADACWRTTGRPAACFATFGPGACNVSTGVCCAFLDRSPMIVLTDEMGDAMLHRTTQMNIDHQSLFRPMTKWTTRLVPGSVRRTLHEALRIARSEVPGPVHIGLPTGVATDEAPPRESCPNMSPAEILPPDEASLDAMEGLFRRSRRPLVAVGNTAVRSSLRAELRSILDRYGVPAIETPMAKGMIPEDHPSYAGVLAHALSDHVAATHRQADLVVAVGYDPVELNYEEWIPDVPLVHIDTVPADIDQGDGRAVCNVVGDLKIALQRIIDCDCGTKDWDLTELAARRRHMFARLSPSPDGFGPTAVLALLRESLPSDGIMTCDVGAHLHLIGQQWKTPAPGCQLMTNGGSSMGYAIPAAIGAKLSCPDRPVCCVVGDGGFMMMAGEMATAARLGTKVVFVLVSDGSLSLIRIKQEKKKYARYGTTLRHDSDGYRSGSTMFGVPVIAATSRDEYERALTEAFDAEGPVIVEAFVETGDYDRLVLRGNR